MRRIFKGFLAAAVLVFPTPPFWFIIVVILVIISPFPMLRFEDTYTLRGATKARRSSFAILHALPIFPAGRVPFLMW